MTTSFDRASSPASPFRSPTSGRDTSARGKAVSMTIRAVRGVHDILPGEGEKWRRVERIARDVFDSYGYEGIRLPIFERTELFARTIGEATDIVQKEMYTFQDRGGDSVTLRPEATAGLLRAYIEHGLFVHPKPIKLYTMGPMFRYERPQAGRYRQFHQLDVEALGDEHASLDAEVIAMLVEFFRRLDEHRDHLGNDSRSRSTRLATRSPSVDRVIGRSSSAIFVRMPTASARSAGSGSSATPCGCSTARSPSVGGCSTAHRRSATFSARTARPTSGRHGSISRRRECRTS